MGKYSYINFINLLAEVAEEIMSQNNICQRCAISINFTDIYEN